MPKSHCCPVPGSGLPRGKQWWNHIPVLTPAQQHMAQEGLPSAMVGMAMVLAVLRLKAPGSLECQGQCHPAAPKTLVFLSFLA